MYLDGQLPYGPSSSNTGAQQNTSALSLLFGNVEQMPAPTGTDPTGGSTNTSSMYTIPGAGTDLVSPSIATTDGVVQFPITSPQKPRFGKMPVSSECQGMSGLGAMDPATYQEHYGKAPPDPAACLSLQCGTTPQAGNTQLNIDCGNFGYAGVKVCPDPASPNTSIQQVTKIVPQPATTTATNYVRSSRPQDTACGSYGSGGMLDSLLTGAATSGLGACCQSGYQAVDSPDIAPPDSGLGLPFLLAFGALILLTSGGR